MEPLDDDLPDLSDTEASLALLLSDCPPGAMLTNNPTPCALLHALYALVNEPTAVDLELERLRLAHTVRVLLLPAHGDERLVLRAEDYSNALQQSGVHGAEALAELLPRFTGVHISRSAIDAPSADALQAAGWLVPARQAAHAAGPDEAPGIDAAAEANDLLLALPGAGRLLVRLTECRRAVLAILYKEKFGRAMAHVVERSPSIRKLLAASKLDLKCVLRDLIGKALIRSTSTAATRTLELTPAGWQAAAATPPRGKKRGR